MCAEPGKLKLITVVKQGSGTVAPTLCDPREALASRFFRVSWQWTTRRSWLSMRLLEQRGTRQNIRKGARVIGSTPACLLPEEERCHSTNDSPLTDVDRRATATVQKKKNEAEDSHGAFRTGLAKKRIRLPRSDPRGTWLQGEGIACAGAALYRSCGGRPMDDRRCSMGMSTKVWRT